MKRIIKKLNFNKKKTVEQKPARITTKTIEQHRREILDDAKKFKYPVQYEKHRLVINAILVSAVFVVLFFAVILWQIYSIGATGIFIYKVSQVIPFSAGEIDGGSILFSDYLAYYRSSWHYHETKEQKNTNSEIESKLQEQYREQAYENAKKIAYAKKLATDKNIFVTDQEVDAELKHKLEYNEARISLSSLDVIVKEYYGLTQNEYRKVFVYYPLLIKKVITSVDDKAQSLMNQIANQAKNLNGAEIAGLYEQYKEQGVEFIDSGVVKYKLNDSGRSEVAAKLQVGQVSDVFVSRNLDSLNIVQLLSKDEQTLRYQVLKVPLQEFNKQLDQASENSSKKYIKGV